MSKTQTDAFVSRAKKALPGGWLGDLSLPGNATLVVARGEGSRIYDVEGRRFLDFTLGGGACILGHTHPAVIAAVTRQLQLGSTFYVPSDRAIELAERLVEIIPCAEQVRFASTGGEATFFALRLARAYTGREKIIKFEGSYLGHHDYAMMNVTPPASNAPLQVRPDSAGIPKAIQDLVIIAPYNDTQTTCRLIEKHAKDVACVIVEPVQRSIPPAPGFLEALRKTTEKHAVLLVYDEVVTGFRLAFGGAQAYFNVTPDIAAFGKAIAGGYPLSAIAGRADIMGLTDPAKKGGPRYTYLSGTLSGNPLCSAASLATLDELAKPGVYEKLHAMGERYRQGLAGLFSESGEQAQAVGIGPMFQVFFNSESVSDYQGQIRADRPRFERFATKMFERNIFVSRRAKNYISTAHTESDLDEFLTMARTVLRGGLDA